MKILVTGFDPFDKDIVNPAYEAVKKLPNRIKDAEIIKLEIPTSFERSKIAIEEAIDKYSPDVVLSIGQAGGRNDITIEKVAINLIEARIKDNDGSQPLDTTIREDGETAYFTNLPIKGMVSHIKENNIPGGFIHVPFLPEQAAIKNPIPSSMSLDMICKSIELAIEAIVLNKQDNKLVSGETH